MKKLSLILALVFALALALPLIASAEPYEYDIGYAHVEPVIDGQTDEIWDSAEWIYFDNVPEDAGYIRYKLLWGEDNKAFILVEIPDQLYDYHENRYLKYIWGMTERPDFSRKPPKPARLFKSAGLTAPPCMSTNLNLLPRNSAMR